MKHLLVILLVIFTPAIVVLALPFVVLYVSVYAWCALYRAWYGIVGELLELRKGKK